MVSSTSTAGAAARAGTAILMDSVTPAMRPAAALLVNLALFFRLIA